MSNDGVSSVNNLYSISKTFDFLARQHQFEGRCAVIMNPDFETLSPEEFFSGLFFLAKSAEIRKIISATKLQILHAEFHILYITMAFYSSRFENTSDNFITCLT